MFEDQIVDVFAILINDKCVSKLHFKTKMVVFPKHKRRVHVSLAMKPRYFKIDDVSYSLRILHRYLFDTYQESIRRLNFIFLENNYPILPDTYQESIQ